MDGPEEGKCRLNATRDGMLFYNPAMVDAINEDVQWILATLPPFVPVRSGENVAAFRILPLTVARTEMDRAVSVARPISVLPFAPLRVGLVTTGREIADGLVKDAFAPKLASKLAVSADRCSIISRPEMTRTISNRGSGSFSASAHRW